MCGPFGAKDDGSAAAAAAAAQRERERQQRISQGRASIDQAFTGFDDNYFSGLTGAYRDYAQPELDEDFSEAKKQLNYALSRKGLSSSTAAADEIRKLNQQYNDYVTDLESSAANYANTARQDVEGARSDLLAQLTATEDPSAAAQSALRRAELLSQPPNFDPLGSFVFNIAKGLEGVSANQGYTGLARSPLYKRKGSAATIVGG